MINGDELLFIFYDDWEFQRNKMRNTNGRIVFDIWEQTSHYKCVHSHIYTARVITLMIAKRILTFLINFKIDEEKFTITCIIDLIS